VFGGYLQSQIACTQCDSVRNSFDGIMDLNLDIKDETATVEEALEMFSIAEKLSKDNKVMCSECNKPSDSVKQITIRSPPYVLAIQLKRFIMHPSGQMRKLDMHIKFDHLLDISRFLSPRNKQSGNGAAIYSLFAVIVHVSAKGLANSGHYVSFVRGSGSASEWALVDDHNVIPVTKEFVNDQQAYVLLYQRSSSRAEPAPLIALPGWDSAKYNPIIEPPAETTISILTASNKSSKKNKKSKKKMGSGNKNKHNGEGEGDCGDEDESDVDVQLCTGGCGFYGSPERGGLCSLCHKKANGIPITTGPPPAPRAFTSMRTAVHMKESALLAEFQHWRRLNRDMTNMFINADARTQNVFEDDVIEFNNWRLTQEASAFRQEMGLDPVRQQTRPQPPPPVQVQQPTKIVPAPTQPAPTIAAPRIGRNDPCPCGSGLKYKKCHEKKNAS